MGSVSKTPAQDIDLAKLGPIFESYKHVVNGALIPVLQAAQDAYSYLPVPVLEAIAVKLDIPISQIYGVVTFYAQFHLEPRGKHVVRTCQGTACHVRNASRILESLKNSLGVGPGGTTEDLQFTLETVACIGACSLAPVMMVDHDTHGRLKPDLVPKILDQYRN
ncbi:MAG: NADH-quinone oxidoreductase subunit NuoE [Deltaproteobacteria bacterium]|jgi:NADH:ubiquinone oxidoreductase subunit E|nr:NADH-quinone oxidoreductase subunit NuoE [Deltaproteobacteria bacterium]